MLQWNDLHPYNALHMVRIPGALDLERLRRLLDAALQEWGLTGLELDRKRGTYRYHGGPARCEIRMVPRTSEPWSPPADEIRFQLNTAFASDEPFTPFRFFVEPAADSFVLGLAYFHAVADAEAIVFLMKGLTEAWLGRRGRGSGTPFDLEPRCTGDQLWRQPLLLAAKLGSLPTLAGKLRRSSRPPYRDAQNLENDFTSFSLGPQDLLVLSRAGQAWDVTINDLFLAVLMKCLSPLAPGRAATPRRTGISLGCIVNTRRDIGISNSCTFGLFLGSFLVTHDVPAGIDLLDLARDIRVQTLHIKEKKLYLATPLELACARRIFSLFSPERQKKFYQKNYPLWGGITNMNLNSLWAQAGEGPADYVRTVSTGPVTPLVLSVTTVRDCVNIGLSYRATVFSTPTIAEVKTCFTDTIRQLASHV